MKTVGKYKEIYKDDTLPSIFDNISTNEHPQKRKILSYMKSAKIMAVAPSILRDIINNERINIELTFLTDGTYGWRADITYYFEKYNLKLDEDFINHVLQKIK